MIHLGLRRFIRLAVDFLSLSFAGPFTGNRFTPFVVRGIPASASSGFHSWPLPRFAVSLFPANRSIRHRTGACSRRYLASTGVLLALTLEVCGCNPVGDPSLAFDPFHHLADQDVGVAEQALSFYDPPDHPAPSSLLASGVSAAGLRPLPAEAKAAPWAIPESVYLIYRSRQTGEAKPRQPPLATAFVLSIPRSEEASRGPNQTARFLVTARHVVDPQWAHCSDRNPVSVDLRLNRRAGGVGYETVLLQNGTAPRFFTSSDPTADLAVIPLDDSLIANLDDYKFLDVPFRVLLSASDVAALHLEQSVMTAGLSTLPSGEPASFPVFDAGSLSQMPADAVGVHCGGPSSRTSILQSSAKQLHVWFISASLPEGVSGAPVFTSMARGANAIKTPVLLGVQSVVWPDKGMAGITPSPVLGDLIRSALRESHLDPGKGRSP